MSGRRSATSCKPCRMAKIGCDAVLQRNHSCTNCVRRGKVCSSQAGYNPNPKQHGAKRVIHPAGVAQPRPTVLSPAGSQIQNASPEDFTSPSLSVSDVESTACRRLHALVLHDLLWDIFIAVFETRYAMWLGDSCCPYLELTVGAKAMVTRVVLQLDSHEPEWNPQSGLGASPNLHTGRLLSPPQSRTTKPGAVIDEALRNVIYAFSARWLFVQQRASQPLSLGGDDGDNDPGRRQRQRQEQRQQDFRNQLWHRAKESLNQVLSRPSYRVVLASLLFSTLEMPVVNDDPGFSHLCSQVCLNHLNYLRAPYGRPRMQPLSQLTSMLPLLEGAIPSPKAESPRSQPQQHMQDMIFWLCILWDVSKSILHRQPQIVLPGASGDRLVWNFIRQRTVIFDQSFRSLHNSPLPLPNDVVLIILQHASACKTMYLGMIAQLCDAIFHQNITSVDDAAERVLQEARRFHEVFDQLLAICARDYLTLNPESQLNYVLLLLHYHGATLMLADNIETLDHVPEPLTDPALSRLHSAGAVVNTLSLALNHDSYSPDCSPYGSKLLLDPMPELTVEGLSRTGRVLFCLYADGKISTTTAQTMLSVLFTALTAYSRISLTATFVLSSLHHMNGVHGLGIKTNIAAQRVLSTSRDEAAPTLAVCDADFVDEFLREAQMESEFGPTNLDKTIKKYEERSSSATGSLQEFIFGSDDHSTDVGQHRSVTACFQGFGDETDHPAIDSATNLMPGGFESPNKTHEILPVTPVSDVGPTMSIST